MQNKLLPCPFCGGEAEIMTGSPVVWEQAVICTNCGTSTKMMRGISPSDCRNRAIASWNTRKPMEQLESIQVIRCKDCDLLQSCKNAQYLGLEGYCSNAEKVV